VTSPYSVRWSQLRIGVLVTLVTVLIAVLVFFIDDVRSAVEDRYSLFLSTLTTQTLRPRAPVWLAGQPVGSVRGLSLAPPSADPSGLLRIELSIDVSAQPFITEGAAAQIISSSLLGEAVVNILPATEPGRPLTHGEELPAASELDPFQVSKTLRVIWDSIRPATDRWREVSAQLRHGRGTLPQLLRRPEEVRELRADLRLLGATIDTIRIAATGFADLMADPEVRSALQRLGPRLQKLADQWDAGSGTLGRFASDTVMKDRLDAISLRFERIGTRLESGRGTLGRWLYDRALADEIARTREVLRDLKREFRAAGGVR
jgi:phospholipid/cholesterol/gamma-HCH transport system substrate-binding protein